MTKFSGVSGPSVSCDLERTISCPQTPSVNNRAIVPTTTEYFTVSVKEVLTLLHSVSSVIPVPFLKESMEVAQNYARFVFSGCTFVEQQRRALNNFQDASAVGRRIKSAIS